jgi:hypothetical protein
MSEMLPRSAEMSARSLVQAFGKVTRPKSKIHIPPNVNLPYGACRATIRMLQPYAPNKRTSHDENDGPSRIEAQTGPQGTNNDDAKLQADCYELAVCLFCMDRIGGEDAAREA